MNCRNCGKKIDEKDNVCRFCGEVLNEERLKKIVPKYCYNCGRLIQNDEIFCKTCGTKFIKSPNSVEKQENSEETRKGRNLSLIALALILASFSCGVPEITFICMPIGIIILVYSNIKYPNNETTKSISKGLFITLILLLFFLIITMYTCIRGASIIADGCQGVGRGISSDGYSQN